MKNNKNASDQRFFERVRGDDFGFFHSGNHIAYCHNKTHTSGFVLEKNRMAIKIKLNDGLTYTASPPSGS